MSAVSPIKLPTLAFVVNPEGHAGIVYDSPTGKRTVLARGTLGPFSWYGTDPVLRVHSHWQRGGDRTADYAAQAFRELAKVEGWTVCVRAEQIAKVLERGEL